MDTTNRRSERSHELTPEERSRGGRERAARIQSAKLAAMAEGRPYKPAKRRRRRKRPWEEMYAARDRELVSPALRQPAPPEPVHPRQIGPMGPGLPRRARRSGRAERARRFRVDLWAMFRVRKRDDLIDP